MTAPATKLRVVPPETPSRQELLRTGVVEAARELVAAMLLEERELLRAPESPAYTFRVMSVGEALQGLRDACYAERRARGGR